MADDERIEQIVRDKALLTSEQIEQVREAIRQAAERGTELSFLAAAKEKGLLGDAQAEDVRQEAEREISTSETQAVTDEAGVPSPDAAASDADKEATREVPAGPEGEAKPADAAAAAPEAAAQPQAARQKPPLSTIVIGIVVLIALTILVAILNRKPS